MTLPRKSWQILHDVDGLKDLSGTGPSGPREKEENYTPLLAQNIVQWMSRSDEPFLKLQSLLVDFVWKILLYDEK